MIQSAPDGVTIGPADLKVAASGPMAFQRFLAAATRGSENGDVTVWQVQGRGAHVRGK